jgi:hypothetical protein
MRPVVAAFLLVALAGTTAQTRQLPPPQCHATAGAAAKNAVSCAARPDASPKSTALSHTTTAQPTRTASAPPACDGCPLLATCFPS